MKFNQKNAKTKAKQTLDDCHMGEKQRKKPNEQKSDL